MSERVSVVVVAYEPDDSLDHFLDSVRTASTQPVDVVVANNGPDDDPAVVRAAQRDGVAVLPTGGNVGYGRAANLAVAKTATEFVLIANPDVEFRPESLDKLLRVTKRWPDGGAFGPLIRTVDGVVYPSARALPSLGRGIGHALCGWWWPANPWTAAYRQERQLPTERPVGWLSGSCLLVRRAAFDEISGFDPAYFMYFEDLDLGERLGKAGWQNIYAPSAEVVHIGGHATERDPSRMAAEHHRSAWRYLSRRYSGVRYLPLRLVLRVGLTGRSVLASRSAKVAEGAQPRPRSKES